MFDQKSRYHDLEDRSYVDREGRQLVYKARRFVPARDRGVEFMEATVAQSDRPDLLAARTLRNPLMFWQLCDANGVMNPHELAEESGRKVRVLLPRL